MSTRADRARLEYLLKLIDDLDVIVVCFRCHWPMP